MFYLCIYFSVIVFDPFLLWYDGCRWMFLDDQSLCIQTSSSFVYGAVPIGASIYVVGDLDTGQWKRTKPNSKSSPKFWRVTATSVFECVRLVLPVCTGTSFDYIREFRRSTGTWHRTKPMLPTDLSKTACAALRIANCRLFRLQLNQGMFRIRVWLRDASQRPCGASNTPPLLHTGTCRCGFRDSMNTKVLKSLDVGVHSREPFAVWLDGTRVHLNIFLLFVIGFMAFLYKISIMLFDGALFIFLAKCRRPCNLSRYFLKLRWKLRVHLSVI